MDHTLKLILYILLPSYEGPIERGFVYIATPPLYLVKKGSKQKYAWNDEERDAIIAELKGVSDQRNVQRYKGSKWVR